MVLHCCKMYLGKPPDGATHQTRRDVYKIYLEKTPDGTTPGTLN